MKEKTFKIISIIVALVIAMAFIAKFGGPALLKSYIYTGIGNCRKIPILCKTPERQVINPGINKEYVAQLLPYVFKDITISLPKGFQVVRGEVKKAYYKKWRQFDKGSVVYLLYEKPDFFVVLFPQLVKEGVKNDYDFISRVMYAQTEKIANFTDTFFVIMKSIFTPDLGDQRDVTMVKFASDDKKGFINYSLGPGGNYFDCNIINNRGDFFKVYIKDKGAGLDLEKVLAVLSTLNKP